MNLFIQLLTISAILRVYSIISTDGNYYDAWNRAIPDREEKLVDLTGWEILEKIKLVQN
ncbi:MAG: hypothetical protein IKS03_04400 [Ruminococcus sp.]|nr:hypothetical protein [Ruminococcus sp.]